MIVTRKEAVELMESSLKTDIPLDGEKLEKLVLAANEDMQVRDYMMGLPIEYGLKYPLSWINEMLPRITKEDSVPFLCVQASYHYELEEQDRAEAILKYVHSLDSEYTLAQLLSRVFTAKWPAESFAKMRKDLHPLVLKEIAEEGDTESRTV